ncbi:MULTISPECIES: hypothetical protein [unclassified Romboutsia]|uniref:hypothetical protein n=1 Tax=unclassified Romboutsia TaxID=2626894 RepID=UPI000821EF5A|nr:MULTISPECIES: hypothetical protein [unclassified Romboutsia]SCI38787.1 Uncharacterised protein [uncultured Clostridium sp.]
MAKTGRKKRKIKKSAILPICLIIFFIVYFLSFWLFSREQAKSQEVEVNTQSQQSDNRSLLTQLRYKNKIYLSDGTVSNIRIEEDYWDELDYILSELKEVRTPESYNEVYSGNSDDGIKFSTDLNYLRIYTVSQEAYYKIPVDSKEEFENVLKKSIYTSFGFVSQYKNWDSVKITYGDKTKKINKWKFDDLSYKMASKRIVGKVQPQKSKERSEYNFTINITIEGQEVVIETMGDDYVKITSHNLQSYYEVHNALYEYIKEDIFKIK